MEGFRNSNCLDADRQMRRVGSEGDCLVGCLVILGIAVLLLLLLFRGCVGGCSSQKEVTEPQKTSYGWFTSQKDIIEKFAMEEQPQAWSLFQRLDASIEVQESRVSSLRRDFRKMGRKPEDDAGFMRLKRQLDELKASHKAIFETLKTGYLEKRKFETQPDSVEVQEWKRSLSECMQESEILLRRFEDLQLEK